MSVVETHWASLECPDGWVRLEHEGAEAVFAVPETPGAFRVNLVLTVVESEAPIGQAGQAAVRAAAEQHPGALVVAYDVGESPVPSRRVSFTYPAGDDAQVDVTKWVWATGSRHIHLSGSAAPYQRSYADPLFSGVASTLRVHGGSNVPASGGPEPDRLEEIDWIAGTQRMRIEGPQVAYRRLDLLASGAAKGRLSRGDAGSPAARELERAGLVDAYGRFTDVGGAVASHWSEDSAVLEVLARTPEREERLMQWAGEGSVLLAASAPVDSEPFGVDEVRLVTMPYERVTALTASWMGVAPAWTRSDGGRTPVSRAAFDARSAGDLDTVPVEAGPVLRSVWERRWTGFRVNTRAGYQELVRVDGAGWLQVSPLDRAEPHGDVTLTPASPLQVFSWLGRAFLDATT